MQDIIINYINNITINELKNLLLKNDILLSKQELNFTYKYIKDNYKNIINNPSSFNFDSLKNNYTQKNYVKLNNLINFYKKKLSI